MVALALLPIALASCIALPHLASTLISPSNARGRWFNAPRGSLSQPHAPPPLPIPPRHFPPPIRPAVHDRMIFVLRDLGC